MTGAARRAVLAAVAALALAAAAPNGGVGAAAAPPPPQPPPSSPPPLEALFGGPFALTDHNGRAVTDETFRGRFALLYFGYTFCPDLCPTNLLTMAEALEALGPEQAGRVQPLFVTVDPERDGPAGAQGLHGPFRPALPRAARHARPDPRRAQGLARPPPQGAGPRPGRTRTTIWWTTPPSPS